MFATANWFLVLFLSGTASAQTGPYFSREACEQAGIIAYNQTSYVGADKASAIYIIRYACVPVPTEGD